MRLATLALLLLAGCAPEPQVVDERTWITYLQGSNDTTYVRVTTWSDGRVTIYTLGGKP